MFTKSKSHQDVSTGRCRFCAKVGSHRFLNREYSCYGFREIYVDIFLECYNLSLSSHSSANQLICLSCVERLREAYTFREMVVKAEQKLSDPLHDNDDAEFVQVGQEISDLKSEVKLEEEDDDLFAFEVNPDSVYDSDSEHQESVASNLVPGEAELLRRVDNARLSLPTLPASFKRHLDDLRGRIILASDVAKILQQTERHADEKPFISEKKAVMHNIITIIKNSNVTPFKSKNNKGYPCLYCRKSMPDLRTLREHISNKHVNEDLTTILWRYSSESLVVYVDVTDLACRLCDEKMADLKSLRNHLTVVHSKTFYVKLDDRMIPFRLSDGSYTCLVCDCTFETFGSIERHMNVHYRNFVCTECGAGFVTKYRLKVHVKSHFGGTFTCSLCSKIFKTHQKLKSHVDSVHRCVKRFKCPNCKERFTEYFARQKHLVEVHNAEPLKYKCNVCDRTFDRRFTLSRHMKKDHLEERNHQCEYCPYRCFTSTELRVHMVKHVGDRIHECAVCKKSYARKKTLTEHMRIHNNDRRHSCNICGQAFIQKCSLKGHLKTHHPEYNVNCLPIS